MADTENFQNDEQSFQIGADHQGFIYHRKEGMFLNGAPVYQCCRGDKGAEDGMVLWLARDRYRHWIARHAKVNSTEPVTEGTRVFKTAAAVEDISAEGEVTWFDFQNESRTWSTSGMDFMTKRVKTARRTGMESTMSETARRTESESSKQGSDAST